MFHAEARSEFRFMKMRGRHALLELKAQDSGTWLIAKVGRRNVEEERESEKQALIDL